MGKRLLMTGVTNDYSMGSMGIQYLDLKEQMSPQLRSQPALRSTSVARRPCPVLQPQPVI